MAQLVEWLLSTLEVRASNPVTFCIVNCIAETKIKNNVNFYKNIGTARAGVVAQLLSTPEFRASNPVTFCIVNCIEMTKIK